MAKNKTSFKKGIEHPLEEMLKIGKIIYDKNY